MRHNREHSAIGGEGQTRGPGVVEGRNVQGSRGYPLEFKAAFWLVAVFTFVSFLLWISLPADHRAVEVLERTWPPLLTGFAGLVFGKLA